MSFFNKSFKSTASFCLSSICNWGYQGELGFCCRLAEPCINVYGRVWHYTCKTETLGSLYSQKSKHQVVHEQKFKDLLSSTCQVSVERIVLDLESEAAWVLLPPGVTFFATGFFSRSKASDVNIANIVNLRKTRNSSFI